jgi:23S rRNA (uridine2552-2'-O)-methyltransferase
VTSHEKPDYWSRKAKTDGYPARSVYKLKEMDEKFGLVKTASRVLDLGAAPGSWSLYVLRLFARQAGFLSAADLSPLSRRYDGGLFGGENFFFIEGDFTTEPVRAALAARGPYTLILSDAAPATTGNRTVDTLRSLALAEAALDYAALLVDGGSLAVKVFQGGDSAALLKQMRERFKTARAFKPKACRSDSFETYFIGTGKRFPVQTVSGDSEKKFTAKSNK